MTNKALAFLAFLFGMTAFGADRVGHFDTIHLLDDTGATYVELKAPASVTTWTFTWPVDDGTSGQFLTTNGSGVSSWSTTLTSPTVSGRIIAGESADYTTGGYLFGETGDDTGWTSPSDGVLYQYGNSNVGSKWDSNGISEMRGVPILFPNSQGAAGSVLTNIAGDGNLGWAAIPSPTLPQNLVESFDPANVGSTRFNIQSAIAPTAPSTGTDINELQVYTDNYAAFSINGTTSINAGNHNLGTADVAYNRIFSSGQTIGNATDPITVGDMRAISSSAHVQAASTASSITGFEYNLIGDVGATVGNYKFIGSTGNVDHFTGVVDNYASQITIGTADSRVSSYVASLNIGTAKDNVVAFADQTIVADMPTRNTGYTSINLGPTVTGSGTTVGGFTEISAHGNVQGHIQNDMSLIEAAESIATIDRNLNYLNVHPNITNVDGNANGYNDSTHITAVRNGSYTGLYLQPNINSLAFNYVGAGINPQVVEAASSAFDFTVTPVADVAGSLAGKSFTIGQAYADGGNNYTPWYKVSGVGTAPICCGNPIEVDIVNGDTAATIATATVAAINSFGAPFGVTITVTDLGGSFSFVSATQGGANPFSPQDSVFSVIYAAHGSGGGEATGLQINMSNATGFNKIPKAIDINGGLISTQLNTAIANKANPEPINTLSVNFGAPASSTISNADQIGLGTPMFVNVGNGSAITSGAFGVGTVATGGFVLNQIGVGATIQDVSAAFYAVLPIPGGPDGGVITTGHGIQIAGIPGTVTGSSTTFGSFKAFEARAPAGPPATGTSWGLWSDPNFGQNYMGGALKIGGSDTATSGVKLEVDGVASFSGNVGVGTTSPAAQLELQNVGTSTLRIASSTDTNANFDFYTNGVHRGLINSNSLWWAQTTIDSTPMWFGTSNVERMRITAAGDVGIGTSSPTTKLDVNGAVNITDAGGSGGNVHHGYVRRAGTTATTSATCTAACNAGEIATGGGCENTLVVGLQNSVLTDDLTQSCAYVLATGDCTATAYCAQY